MRCTDSLVALVAAVLVVTPTVAHTTDEPEVVAADDPAPPGEPRMVGEPGAARVRVFDTLVSVGDDLAYLGARGREGVGLRWIDGESGKDRRLAEVASGEISHEIEALGDGVIFTGHTDRTSWEPWRSDGTKAGTRMLKNVARGRVPNFCAPGFSLRECGTHAADSGPGPFVTMGDIAYFSAYDQKRGRELWRSDGTRDGTRLLKDILPGKKSGFDRRALSAVDGELYFAADDGRHGSELWRSDGTRAGTRMITDIGPGWSVQWWDAPVVAGDHVYFGARSADEGLELWRTDGTPGGTVLVRDIRPGPRASKPEDLIALGDQLYFTAIDGEHGRELWRTDGTAEGTALVKDIVPGKEGSLLGEFAVLGDSLYFALWGDPGEFVIPGVQYRSDGTEAGTQPFGPAQDGTDGLRRFWTEFPATVTLGDRLFFPADDGIHGLELWSTDGTLEGTGLVSDLRPGPEGSDPESLVAAETYIYFTAADGEHGRQFWQLPVADA